MESYVAQLPPKCRFVASRRQRASLAIDAGLTEELSRRDPGGGPGAHGLYPRRPYATQLPRFRLASRMKDCR